MDGDEGDQSVVGNGATGEPISSGSFCLISLYQCPMVRDCVVFWSSVVKADETLRILFETSTAQSKNR